VCPYGRLRLLPYFLKKDSNSSQLKPFLRCVDNLKATLDMRFTDEDSDESERKQAKQKEQKKKKKKWGRHIKEKPKCSV